MAITVDDQISNLPHADVFAPLRVVIEQLAHVIESLEEGVYAAMPAGPFQGSIGGHVRHCLDHVQVLVDGIGAVDENTDGNQRVLNYDHRQRGTTIETDGQAALQCIRELSVALMERRGLPAHHPVTVEMMLTGDGQSARLRSTLGRELVFVLSHTIHHNAMIGAMVRAHGGQVPTWFGYAPSTVAHLSEQSG